MKLIGYTLLASVILFLVLIFIGGILGWYCAIHEQVRILNATGIDVEVTSAHTRTTITIKDQKAGVLPHSMGDITVKHPDGKIWVYDNISPDSEFGATGKSPYVTILSYPVPFGGQSRTTGFMLDKTGRLYVVPIGVEAPDAVKKTTQPDGYPARANEKRNTPFGDEEDQFIEEHWARKANQAKYRGSEDRVRKHLSRHGVTYNGLSKNGDYLCILDLSKTEISDLSVLAGLPIGCLDLSDTDVRDLSPLAGMPLSQLKLTRCSAVSDLTPLKGMRLTELSLVETVVEDISPLAGMPITHLYLQDTKVSDIEAVAGMPLNWLIIDHCNVSDLSPLSGGELKQLNCIGTDVTDLTPLKGMPIDWLHAEHSKIIDTSVLRGMPLKWLHLAGTPITDIMAIKGTTLDELDISNTAISQLPSISCAPNAYLNLEHTNIADLSFLQSPTLGSLYVAGSAITDLSPLEGKSIEHFSFSPQRVTNGIDVLRHMRSLRQVGISRDQLMPAAEFWKKYDAVEFQEE